MFYLTGVFGAKENMGLSHARRHLAFLRVGLMKFHPFRFGRHLCYFIFD
jgi:hypothetical protein